jgi:hypothetical protein
MRRPPIKYDVPEGFSRITARLEELKARRPLIRASVNIQQQRLNIFLPILINHIGTNITVYFQFDLFVRSKKANLN